MAVYKYMDYYIAGVEHVVKGYLQDVVVVYRQNNSWNAVSAERFRSNDATLNEIKEAVKYATHEDDLKVAVERLRKKGIKIEEVKENNIPFPRKLIEGKKKIQAEFD